MSEPFTPHNSALVLVDHKVGTLQLIRVMSADELLRGAVILARTAKALSRPVVPTSSQEDVSRRRAEREGAALATTDTIAAEFVQDWSAPEGSELVKLPVAAAPMMQAT